ncbi:cupin domain-containing protein [Pyruvatibacter mobilis]|uniref:cupin domain-containing protein n=1 Tax=Pyruvatibacter mobilis TaxID=1712261 RepID=UPI003C7B382B
MTDQRSGQKPITLHADLSLPAEVDTAALDWVPSPMAGVERRMIERDGGEVARATSLVRYQPGSRFSAHRHDMGEEYLVLEGTFSDNDGDFPVGSYVRNPPGSSHAPHTDEGAMILVKLRQMPEDETRTVHVDTLVAPFLPAGAPGHERQVLFEADYERVAIERLRPGGSLEASRQGGEELFVLDGTLSYGGDLYKAGAWIRRAAGHEQPVASPDGVRFWVKRGHLPG